MLPENRAPDVKLGAPRILAQVTFYVAVGLFIGYFTYSPTYQYTDGSEAELKFVVRHSGNLIGECRTLTSEEMGNLPPNMRKPQVCPREKAPLTVALSVNGNGIYDKTIEPSGLQSDGVIALYKRFPLPADVLDFQLAIEGGETYKQTVEAHPGDVLLMQYDDSGFHLRRAGDESE